MALKALDLPSKLKMSNDILGLLESDEKTRLAFLGLSATEWTLFMHNDLQKQVKVFSTFFLTRL